MPMIEPVQLIHMALHCLQALKACPELFQERPIVKNLFDFLGKVGDTAALKAEPFIPAKFVRTAKITA